MSGSKKIRILGGEYKGRIIHFTSKSIRPTKSIIRERIWNILIHSGIALQSFLDIFAGSGIMGIEAMSRGIPEVYFVDRCEQSIAHIRKFVKILNSDKISRAIKSNVSSIPEGPRMNVVFMDPPYKKPELFIVALQKFTKRGWIDHNSLIIFETHSSTPLSFVSQFIEVNRDIHIGNSSIYFGYMI